MARQEAPTVDPQPFEQWQRPPGEQRPLSTETGAVRVRASGERDRGDEPAADPDGTGAGHAADDAGPGAPTAEPVAPAPRKRGSRRRSKET